MHVYSPAALLLVALATPAAAKVDDLPAFARRYLDQQVHAVLPSRDVRGQPMAPPTLRLVPSFARQTGFACSMCHYQFPQLTAFGRQFKLNGYTLTGLKTVDDKDERERQTLNLLPFTPLSMMMQASATQLRTALPGTQNFTVSMPQQLGVLWAGAIANNLGTMAQVTWAPASGTFAIDNVDVRYVGRGTIGEAPVTWGVSFNNNPSVQDLWNTTPAWGYPFASSSVAPNPAGAPLIAGGLAQRSVGVGVYALWNDLLYTEIAGYRSAIPTAAAPLDSSARNAISGFTPYWRVALQKTFGTQYLMIGTYGLAAKLFPAGVGGLTNDFTDIGFDAQHEMPVGDGHLVTRLSYVTENQTLAAGFAATPATSANRSNSLNSLRLNSSWYPAQHAGLTVGLFTNGGTADTLLYAPGAVTGSAIGSPESTGASIEATYNLWENARLSVTYTMYSKFNGRDANYDGAGRSASANNTLYLLWWFAF